MKDRLAHERAGFDRTIRIGAALITAGLGITAEASSPQNPQNYETPVPKSAPFAPGLSPENYKDLSCPEGVSTIYRGGLTIRNDGSEGDIFALAVPKDVVAERVFFRVGTTTIPTDNISELSDGTRSFRTDSYKPEKTGDFAVTAFLQEGKRLVGKCDGDRPLEVYDQSYWDGGGLGNWESNGIALSDPGMSSVTLRAKDLPGASSEAVIGYFGSPIWDVLGVGGKVENDLEVPQAEDCGYFTIEDEQGTVLYNSRENRSYYPFEWCDSRIDDDNPVFRRDPDAHGSYYPWRIIKSADGRGSREITFRIYRPPRTFINGQEVESPEPEITQLRWSEPALVLWREPSTPPLVKPTPPLYCNTATLNKP